MIIGCACRDFMAMVGDRLITLQRSDGSYAGQHDTVSNKNLIYRTSDAVVAIGYAGAAYLEGVPTDQWIAQVLSGARLAGQMVVGPPVATRWAFPVAMFRLREALLTAPGGHGVGLLVTGYRVRRGLEIPVLLRFGAEPRRAATILRMRPFPRASGFQLSWIGVPPDPGVLDQRMSRFNTGAGLAISAAEARDTFAGIIRDVAGTAPTVGADLMEIVLDRIGERKVVCRFSPAVASRGALQSQVPSGINAEARIMSPWIIGQTNIYPPTVMSGAPGPAT